MSTVSDLLSASRSAHQQAKKSTTGKADAQRLFAIALDQRLQARTADPDRLDPSWDDDALHPAMPGEKGRRYLRMPGLTRPEIALQQDANLERYFREQLGEIDVRGCPCRIQRSCRRLSGA